jgi:hypothetical protein
MNSNEPADAHATQIAHGHEAAHRPGAHCELSRDLTKREQGPAPVQGRFVLASERRAPPRGYGHFVGVRLHLGPPE